MKKLLERIETLIAQLRAKDVPIDTARESIEKQVKKHTSLGFYRARFR